MKYFAVIVAGGSGMRMNAALPKQFLILNGKPIMMHTILAFQAAPQQPEIIVVINQAYFDIWKNLCEEYNFNIPHTLVPGGNTRFDSVKNALALINEKAIVAIHDAVRPLISPAIIAKAYQQALNLGNAVVAMPSKDSVRVQNENGVSKNLNRNDVYLVQTPQTFPSEILKIAYEQEYQESFTDDASVVEMSGENIHLVTGNPENFKITFPVDLLLAELILQEKSR